MTRHYKSKSTGHNEMVNKLLDSGARCDNFRGFVQRKYSDGCDDDFAWITCVPDAYRIVGDDLHVYEVECTNRISDAKLEIYAWLWFTFDSCIDGWLKLFCLDKFGNSREIDLKAQYDRLVRKELSMMGRKGREDYMRKMRSVLGGLPVPEGPQP